MGWRPHDLTLTFLFIVLILSFSIVPMPLGAQTDFVRGDCLGDGNVELGDLIYMLCVFCDPGPIFCFDACDADDNGIYTLSDPIYLLNYLFEGGVPLPAPFPNCGADPTDDTLSCNNYQHDCQTPPPPPPLDPGFIFSIADGVGSPGETISVEVQLEIVEGGNTLAACSFGVGHDPAALSLIGAQLAADIGEVDFSSVQIHDGGWTTAIIISFLGINVLTDGNYLVATAQYQVLGDVGDVTIVDFVDTLGDPPIETRVVPKWGPEFTPSSIAGSVSVTTGFRRGDVNLDGTFDIGDPIWALLCLFTCFPDCFDAHDSNDDGLWNIADPIYMLSYLFVGGAPPPPPFIECGADPTEDALDCDNFDSCP
ncbi:MAG: hypothetical protein AAEJ65_08440 [Planctomycetota bacterium]